MKIKPIIEGVLNFNQYMITKGVKDTEKTWISAYKALCVATGKPFFGHKVKKGKVVFVYGEGLVADRLFLLMKGMGIKRKPNNLFLYPLRADLSEKDSWEDFLNHIPQGAILVIMDNFEKFWGSDQDKEDVASAMRLMLQMREKTSIDLIHHEIKRQSASTNSHAKSKGDSKIINCADTSISLSRVNGAVKVEFYNRDMESIEPILFKRRKTDNGGMILELVGHSKDEGLTYTTKIFKDDEAIHAFLTQKPASEADIKAGTGLSRERVKSGLYRLNETKRIRHNGLKARAGKWECVKSC